jgi:hypothetical protein
MSATTPASLQLAHPPLAAGGFCEIYQHPHQEDVLVKVLRPSAMAQQPERPFGGLRHYGRYARYARELREYLAVRARTAECPDILQTCYGFVDTDRGLGLVVEKLTGSDGDLAPNVAAVARTRGINTRLWELCEGFYAEVRRHQLVISDLDPVNMVYAANGGRERLVLVDGLGERTLIPLRTFSRAYNRYQTERSIRLSKLRIMQHAAGLYRPGRISRSTARQLKLEDLLNRHPQQSQERCSNPKSARER